MSNQLYDIPVLFQVKGKTEDDAATRLMYRLVDAHLADTDTFESWHMPNHKHIDGSDEPVRIVIIPEISPLRSKA